MVGSVSYSSLCSWDRADQLEFYRESVNSSLIKINRIEDARPRMWPLPLILLVV